MDVSSVIIYQKKIRLFLVFFCIVLIFSCVDSTKNQLNTKVKYVDNKAVSVTLLSTTSFEDVQLFLHGMPDTPVLGDFETVNGELTFMPLVPFTNGNTYEIYQSKKRLAEFTINALMEASTPKITAIYPSTDTIPENLLKMYFVFSKPMQEVQSALDFIEVYNVTDDTPTTIFLELENELWNTDHTELTLWLDPGRIKTDLIPNRTKGLPIEAGKEYRITIRNTWKDAENNPLDSEYTKKIYVTSRDSEKITLENWSVRIPSQGTHDKLVLDVREPLDAMLALETIDVLDAQNNKIEGIFKLARKEQQVWFMPKKPWRSSNYEISVLAVLEDLAGNNLNHLFDKDLLLETDEEYTKHHTMSFTLD